ncbi:MAG: hypothetical protein HY708_06445 [Ignavibacteriae bacterium]|nr:hypothetical protein [Ignavibacteriota bacterium]
MKTPHIIVLTICIMIAVDATAQQDWKSDPELAEMVVSLGVKGAADSCRNVVRRIDAALSSRTLYFSEQEQVRAVQCSRWLGLLGDQQSLPILEKVLAHKRTTGRLDPLGRYLLELQGTAFSARVDLLMKAKKRKLAFNELISLFKKAPRSQTLTLHERDMIDFARVELAARDEFYPMLLAFAQKEYLPLSLLRAEGSEAKYESFLDFKRIATAGSPAERDAVLSLLVHKSGDVRELGAELLDLSEETVDTLVAMFRTRKGEAQSTIRAALQSIDTSLINMIRQSEEIVSGMPDDSENRAAIQQEIDMLVRLREKIGLAIKGSR